MNGLGRTAFVTFSASDTFIVDLCQIVGNGNSSLFTIFSTFHTTDTCCRTIFLGVHSFFFVGTCHPNHAIVGYRYCNYQATRTCFCTRTARNTNFGIEYRQMGIRIDSDATKLAGFYTIATADTSVAARERVLRDWLTQTWGWQVCNLQCR